MENIMNNSGLNPSVGGITISRKGVRNSIQNALEEGFSLTEEGLGNYNEREQYWRSQNKIVVSWYVGTTTDGQKKYELYTRDKKTRGAAKKSEPKKIEINYETLTVKELREIGKQYNLRSISKLSKSSLIEKIKEVA